MTILFGKSIVIRIIRITIIIIKFVINWPTLIITPIIVDWWWVRKIAVVIICLRLIRILNFWFLCFSKAKTSTHYLWPCFGNLFKPIINWWLFKFINLILHKRRIEEVISITPSHLTVSFEWKWSNWRIYVKITFLKIIGCIWFWCITFLQWLSSWEL